MSEHFFQTSSSSSRRVFLKQTGNAVAGATLAGSLARSVHAAEDNTLKIALVGCGRRGRGAALNALSTAGPTKLVAMADVFEQQIETSIRELSKRRAKQLDVPKERCFVGMDGFRSAIDAVSPGGVVVLGTPPCFRPPHFEYAVEKGCHVFMEKSFGVDSPGVRRIIAAGKEADKKNLKVGCGLNSRHCQPLVEAIKRIHDGAIGEIIAAWAYRLHGSVDNLPRRPGESELAYQIRNHNGFTWLGGSHVLDWMVHSLDVACWAKQAWPIDAQGQGGRQVRNKPDQLYDHYTVEYTYSDGTRLVAEGRNMPGCWNHRAVPVHGTKGSAMLGEKLMTPFLYSGHRQTRDEMTWRYRGKKQSSYQVEHDHLFEAIRKDLPYNETERSAMAAMTGVLGRMAIESGQKITWDEAMASDVELAPGLDQMTMASVPPVLPDADGHYPIATPGVRKK